MGVQEDKETPMIGPKKEAIKIPLHDEVLGQMTQARGAELILLWMAAWDLDPTLHIAIRKATVPWALDPTNQEGR